VWFDTEAQEAADFHISVFKNSRIVNVNWEQLTEGGEESQCGWLEDRYGR
jgi:predicted 3-demethylubiquinone-9 3-methyltransferase (glyoxalase superfamily)